jgi:hypothetical protein
MGKTLSYEVFDNKLLLLVHGESSPSSVDWDDYAELLSRSVGELTGILVVTDGAGPNGAQRGKINDLIKTCGGSFPTAVMTHSRVARGVVTALGWFNPRLRAFAPTELTAALAHLGTDPGQREKLLRCIVRMRIELSARTGPHVVTSPPTTETTARMETLLTSRLPKLRETLATRSVRDTKDGAPR